SPGSATNLASPVKRESSALTTSTCKLAMYRPWLECLGFFEGFVYGSHHVVRLLGQCIALPFDDHAETTKRFGQRHEFARCAGKDFGAMERLRKETLNFACSCHGLLV